MFLYLAFHVAYDDELKFGCLWRTSALIFFFGGGVFLAVCCLATSYLLVMAPLQLSGVVHGLAPPCGDWLLCAVAQSHWFEIKVD